jgi:hypothetical protein
MMDFPTPFNEIKERDDEQVPDSPGDALGALKKVVEGRQKRIGTTIAINVLHTANMRRTLESKHPQGA